MNRILVAVSIAVSWAVCVALAARADESAGRASAGCGAGAPLAAGESETFSMRVGDLDREYRVHLPTNYDPSRPTSLMLDFHGYTGTAAGEENYTRLSRHADEHGFVVVYPQGTGFVAGNGQKITSWNDLAGSASPGPEGPICSETAFEYPHPPECGEPRPATGPPATTTWASSTGCSIDSRRPCASTSTASTRPA